MEVISRWLFWRTGNPSLMDGNIFVRLVYLSAVRFELFKQVDLEEEIPLPPCR
jgi:hypothetical protein